MHLRFVFEVQGVQNPEITGKGVWWIGNSPRLAVWKGRSIQQPLTSKYMLVPTFLLSLFYIWDYGQLAIRGLWVQYQEKTWDTHCIRTKIPIIVVSSDNTWRLSRFFWKDLQFYRGNWETKTKIQYTLIPLFNEKQDLASFPEFNQVKSCKGCEIVLHGLYHEDRNGRFDDFHMVTKRLAEEEIRAAFK